jgi:signal transduction histidine kinase
MTILLVFFVIFIFFRQYYHGQLQKQLINLEKKQLIEKERSRIAIDMHDDMGAGLSRIKVLSETIKFENQKGIVNPVHLQKISSYSEEMMDKMGEIVWALNQQNDSIDDLLAYTRSYAVDYLTSHGINCVFLAPPEHTQVFVSGEMRRNIFLSVKEVLHNVVKHAEATRVEIAINLGKQLLILIRDNGKGIDTGKVRKFGNGINNISKRMADIGGTATFKSQNGTVVALQVQLD